MTAPLTTELLGIVYLLHFERPISDRHTCQHYLGWCLDLVARLALHRSGCGARLTQVAVERGIGFEVVRTWVGSRAFERYLKNGKRSPRLCPVCYPTRQPRPAASAALQLELPIDDFPPPSPCSSGRFENAVRQSWRAARIVPAPAVGDWDEGLL